MTAVLGFAGLLLRTDGIELRPQPPQGWRSLGFSIQWRGRRLEIYIDQAKDVIEATLRSGNTMSLFVNGLANELLAGVPLRISAYGSRRRVPPAGMGSFRASTMPLPVS